MQRLGETSDVAVLQEHATCSFCSWQQGSGASEVSDDTVFA